MTPSNSQERGALKDKCEYLSSSSSEGPTEAQRSSSGTFGFSASFHLNLGYKRAFGRGGKNKIDKK